MNLEPGPEPAVPSPKNAIPRARRFLLGMVVVAVTAVPMFRILEGGGRAVGSTEVPVSENLNGTVVTPGVAPTSPAPGTPNVGAASSSSISTALPPMDARYEVPSHEAEPEAKQLAVDVAESLTTYDPLTSYEELLRGVAGDEVIPLFQVAAPLYRPDHWSRGSVVYPQLGGLRDGRASVMVMIRQVIGRGADVSETVVRTLDIRLVAGEDGWEFESLASAGGAVLQPPEALSPEAEQVLADPRIELPDSARWDIYSGTISPKLLRVMIDIAEQTDYGVVVLSTGHPYHVFGTDRQSHHTSGTAVDIYRVGSTEVIDDRHEDSATMDLVRWLLAHPDVRQVGSPWDLDGRDSSRSFTDRVHHDHLHVAVNG